MNQYNLLQQLEVEDYDALIEQVKLAQKGYDFHFIIDADLVGNYCYPKGIIESETSWQRMDKLTTDYLSDEQITLHSIFYIPENHQRLLLLNEYYFEVEGMLYKASKVGKAKIGELDLQFGYFSYPQKGELLDLLYGSFADMLTKALLHIDGIKKAKKLLDARKLIMDSSDLPSIECKEIVEGCLAIASNVELVKDVMYRVVNKGRRKKQDLLTSKNRDAIIIDRLLCFNRTSERKKAKQVYILLSDSTIMKNTLKSIRRENKEIKYPLIGNKRIEFYRSIPQSFAYTICLSYEEEEVIDYKKTITNIENLKKATIKLRERFNDVSSSEEEDLTSKEIFTNYRMTRTAFENSGFLKSFNPLYESIKTDFVGKKIEDVAKIFEAYAKEGNQLLEVIENKHIYFLRKLIKIGEFNSAFIYGIDRIKNQGETFDLSKGADYVEGTFHHLPLYLTFTESEFKQRMFKLVDLVLSRKIEQSSEICKQLEGLLKEMNTSKLHDLEKTDINLIKAFIFMIIPGREEKRGAKDKENDLMANSWLNDLEISEDDEEAKCNKLYLQIWALRRINKYRDSVKLANQAIEKFPDDPRFYHGLFLSQYCISEEKNNKDHNLINKMLENLRTANILYQDFMIQNFEDQNKRPLVLKSIDQSYLNSLSYCLALKASNLKKKAGNEKYVNLLKDARSTFASLKNKDNQFYDELPEYLDTEAFIEFLESFYVADKSAKIKYAESAILKAIELSNNEYLVRKYTSRLNTIRARMKELAEA